MNNAPRTCTDCNRKLNSANTKVNHQNDLCDDCFDLAGLENEHQDGMHEDAADPDCLMCDPAARADRSRTAKAPKAHTRTRHDACYAAGTHDKTPKGRAACRASRNA